MGVCVPEAVRPARVSLRRHIPAIRCSETRKHGEPRGFPGDRHPPMVPATILTAQVLPGTVPSHARQSAWRQHLPSPAATVADKLSGTEFRNIL
ncbi:MAG: hypothetical protein ACYDHY_04495 [Acidiferrobacterales bacterium]